MALRWVGGLGGDLGEVGGEGADALVAVLGGLGEEALDQQVERGGEAGAEGARRGRRTGDDVVQEPAGIVGEEGAAAGEELEVEDAEGVEVAAVIDGSIEAARRLGGAVDQLRDGGIVGAARGERRRRCRAR